MALFDVFDAVSEKQLTKTEYGDERIYGTVIGIVAQNYTQEMPGRLCVTVPVRDADANQLKWAKVTMPYIGSDWGVYFLPEKGDQVLLIFEDGNIEKPYVIGCIPKDKDKFLKNTANEHNQIKQLQTRNGSRISFWDDENEDGAKDKITIATAQEEHHIDIDNEADKIAVYDKEKHCLVEMNTGEGVMKVHAQQRLEITVGDTIKVMMNGESGKVRSEAKSIAAAASSNIQMEADGNIKVSGRQVSTEATSLLKNEVKAVPGLSIHKIGVHSETRQNEIHITVKPNSLEAFPRLSDTYRNEIGQYLEKYRMLTTKIVIKQPVYVPIHVTGTIAVRKHLAYDREKIERALKKMLDGIHSEAGFGCKIVFHELYHCLRNVECVEEIYDLSIFPDSSQWAEKVGLDIQLKANALYYPGKLRIEAVR